VLQGLVTERDRQASSSSQKRGVLILARYNHSLPSKYDQQNLQDRVPRLSLRWMTIHKAKGLEDDYVVLLDMTATLPGFPCEIVDDPILNLVLPAHESYPQSEERRVLYVALTRARTKCIVITDEEISSAFCRELISSDFGEWVDSEDVQASTPPRCPSCSGALVYRPGKFKPFWGCSNYPLCDGRVRCCDKCGHGAMIQNGGKSHCSKCDNEALICPSCKSGFLVTRSGPYGLFTACSNWNPEAAVSCSFRRTVKVHNRPGLSTKSIDIQEVI
jgi:DNA helicase-4